MVKRGLRMLVAATFVAALALTGCVHTGKDTPKPAKTDSSASKEAPQSLPGAIDLKADFEAGSMWAQVGPLYRLDNGNSALALTVGCKDVNSAMVKTNIGTALTTPDYPAQKEYSGMFLLTDTEVFEPWRDDQEHVPYVKQDGTGTKNSSFSGKDGDPISESVLVPFGDIGDNPGTVGVDLGLIGFAYDVPVQDATKAPKSLQKALDSLPDQAAKDNHGEYSAFTIVPGMDVASSSKSLDVTLAADVFFDSGKWDIKPEAQATLDDLAKALATHEPGEVTIVGHTDNVPEPTIGNQALSENRANAVKAVLEGKSELSGFTFSASGKGDTQPAVPNTDDVSRAKNRRVQVSINTPVKKEILELQATSAEMPAPYAQESDWPKAVLYNVSRSDASKPQYVQISTSQAVAYPNYTLVTFTVEAVDQVGSMQLNLGGFHRPEETTTNISSVFYGPDILLGSARTVPLEYPRIGVNGKNIHGVVTGGSLGAIPLLKPGEKWTVPVLYPPVNTKTITIDASKEYNHVKYGYRINDVPVKQAGEASGSPQGASKPTPQKNQSGHTKQPSGSSTESPTA